MTLAESGVAEHTVENEVAILHKGDALDRRRRRMPHKHPLTTRYGTCPKGCFSRYWRAHTYAVVSQPSNRFQSERTDRFGLMLCDREVDCRHVEVDVLLVRNDFDSLGAGRLVAAIELRRRQNDYH